jgi:hypothetical protein
MHVKSSPCDRAIRGDRRDRQSQVGLTLPSGRLLLVVSIIMHTRMLHHAEGKISEMKCLRLIGVALIVTSVVGAIAASGAQ